MITRKLLLPNKKSRLEKHYLSYRSLTRITENAHHIRRELENITEDKWHTARWQVGWLRELISLQKAELIQLQDLLLRNSQLLAIYGDDLDEHLQGIIYGKFTLMKASLGG